MPGTGCNPSFLRRSYGASANSIAQWGFLARSNRDSNSDDEPELLEALLKKKSDRTLISKYAPWIYKVQLEGVPTGEKSTAYRRAIEDDRACQTSTIEKATISENLKVISSHIPGFWHSQRRLSPLLLIRMAEDLEAVFDRAAILRSNLPDNSLTSVLGQRPELLLQEDFAEVMPAMESLQCIFREVDVGLAVSRQPYFLVGHVDELIEELRQLPQARNAAHQAHFMMMHLGTSAILDTETYKRHRKKTTLAYSKPRQQNKSLQPIPVF